MFYCGVVQCLSEHEILVRHISMRKLVFIIAVHRGDRHVLLLQRRHTRQYAFSTR